jgi:hypothetical protein
MRGGGASATIEACVNHAKEIAMSKKDENLTAEYENGKGDDREGGFIKSSPEANAGPAGAAQTSQGSAQGNQNDSGGISGSASASGVGASADGVPKDGKRPIGSLADDKPSM